MVIPAYNEKKVIERLLVSLKRQTYKKIEIIVVDDASSDSTAKLARNYTSKVFTRSHAERSVQRNFGAIKSLGKFLFFLDADMKLSKDVVKNCVSILERDENIGAVTILEKSVAKTFWEKVKAFERSFYNEEGDSVSDAARFFPRKIFEKVGGYDGKITGPEDWDITDKVKKLGYKIGTCRELIYHYERVLNPLKLAQKKYYYALKSHRYLEKQNVSIVSSKMIYFLRPVFYKNWKKIIQNPLLSLSMFFMLFVEQIGGSMGFLIGKIQNK